jgi:putative transposase
MPRQSRQILDGGIYHVLNRGNCKMPIFEKPGDFAAFVKLLEQARERSGMRILGFCLMNNHWHLALWPKRGKDLSEFIQWLCTTHVRRWRAHRENVGEGHLYQGRYKSFLVEEDLHYLTMLRYVESNALRAGLVNRAEDWPWSSLANPLGADGKRVRLTEWPVDRPRDWIDLVNETLPKNAIEQLGTSIRRGRPFGTDSWVARTVNRLGIQSTLRDPWRPKSTKTSDAKSTKPAGRKRSRTKPSEDAAE